MTAEERFVERLVELFNQAIGHLSPEEQEARIAKLEAHLGEAEKA